MIQREAWFEEQLDLDPDRLVFVDESWASTAWRAAMAAVRAGSGCG